ncbi:MAG: CDP-diacylglycerol--glycerol-3-phosphate 3-phosphatidyltransferase [Candidatus Omnitrophica bacterium]|nr:CDP-diacylglycerol--glycerol-3-phosphate 3-phosphatidyltransferase [Candidatus Omnitrophota bacterium]
MNIANVLTTSRIALTIVFLLFVVQTGFQAKLIAALVFLAASITDYLDGYLARKYNLVTNYGKLMDPIADKFLVLSAFAVFGKLEVIPFWMVLIIFIREVALTFYRLVAVFQGNILAAENLGKWKTVLQMGTLFIILFFVVFRETPIGENLTEFSLQAWHTSIYSLMILTVLLTVISALSYFKHYVR